MRLCSGAGCGRAVGDAVRLCDECANARLGGGGDGIREHALQADGEQYAHLYKSDRWKRSVQPRFLMKHPFCQMCETSASELVDHIIPAGVAIRQAKGSGRFGFDTNAGFYLECNLQALCRSCHAKKTARDKEHTGEWPSVMETYDKAPKKVWSF